MTLDSQLSTPTDEDLACRAQQGCATSLDELLRRFQSPLLHFLRQRGPAVEAEDLLQETFLLAYRNLHRYDRRRRFAPWIFTIARRASVTRFRRWQPPVDGSDVSASVAPGPGALESLAVQERCDRLWAIAAAVLSEEETTALWLLYVEAMPTAEIAAVLDRSRAAVKILLFRARRRLSPHLSEFDLSDERAPHRERCRTDRRADVRPLPLEVQDV